MRTFLSHKFHLKVVCAPQTLGTRASSSLFEAPCSKERFSSQYFFSDEAGPLATPIESALQGFCRAVSLVGGGEAGDCENDQLRNA
jgi:hypothetical protein